MCFGYSGFFAFPYKLSDKLYNFYRYACWGFARDFIEHTDQLGGNCHCDSVDSSNQWTGNACIYLGL